MADSRVSPSRLVGLNQVAPSVCESKTGAETQRYGHATVPKRATATATGPVHKRPVNRRAATAVNTTILATEAGSKAVDTGLLRFEELTRGFKQIAGMVDTATQAAREIGLSTKQQMTAVEQVNSAIVSAAQVTRETEASSVQTLQTATQLAQLSRSLSSLVQSRATA